MLTVFVPKRVVKIVYSYLQYCTSAHNTKRPASDWPVVRDGFPARSVIIVVVEKSRGLIFIIVASDMISSLFKKCVFPSFASDVTQLMLCLDKTRLRFRASLSVRIVSFKSRKRDDLLQNHGLEQWSSLFYTRLVRIWIEGCVIVFSIVILAWS